ncbi:hypothetical protein TeGR_g2800 [Tetraparma gracilis]|uniref:Peptidase S54 rhomboid domain-containing protein n=1 Tax=Tetraparma gracilis TaxID=2962635 RepID=A0ABQ6MZQ7_9STRA|nr:hypothetical protein TeGR_g2800 [Tetraparma gracilis]
MPQHPTSSSSPPPFPSPPPLITSATILLCTSLHLAFSAFDVPLFSFTLSPRSVLALVEPHRLLTSAVLHGGWLHLGMNMASTFVLSGSLERKCGSLFLLHLVLLLTLLNSCLYVAVAYAGYLVGHSSLLTSHAVGYSGTIFALLSLQVGSEAGERSLWGAVTVSSKVYPWALLVALQVLMPDVSFLGHLGGILVGRLAERGGLNALLPHPEYYRLASGARGPLGRFAASPLYFAPPAAFAGFGRAGAGACADAGGMVTGAAGLLRDALAAAAHVLGCAGAGAGAGERWARAGHNPDSGAGAAAVRRAEAASLLAPPVHV